jgi:hypothetical protein
MRRKIWCDGWKRKYFGLGWGSEQGLKQLWVPSSTVPGRHCAACQKWQSLNSIVGYGGINSKAGDGHPVPEGVDNKTRQHQYSLSLVRPSPSNYKRGYALSLRRRSNKSQQLHSLSGLRPSTLEESTRSQHLTHVWAPVTLFHSDQSPTGPLSTPHHSSLICTPHCKFWAPGLRNKVTDRLKLDLGHVAWTSINSVSLNARPHLISTHGKTTNIYGYISHRQVVYLFIFERTKHK